MKKIFFTAIVLLSITALEAKRRPDHATVPTPCEAASYTAFDEVYLLTGEDESTATAVSDAVYNSCVGSGGF